MSPSCASIGGGSRPSRTGFTLLELMIAVSLSAMIVYTAFSAFRVVGQSVTSAKRMSTENTMLRIGFFSVLDEMDFWDLYDNRDVPNPEANKSREPGKPFAPMVYDSTRKPNDPRTWWRGFGFGEDPASTDKWGRWHELSKTGHLDDYRRWYPEQIQTFKQTLGDYGMISYLQPNGIFCWYSGTTLTGQPKDIWHRTSYDPVTANGLSYDLGPRRDLVPQNHRPAHWPTLTYETRRYVVWSSFIDLCQVEITNALTGEPTRLSFWDVGTSLRGARQQRLLDSVPTSVLTPTPPPVP